jgi:hypothetical protein
MNAYSYHDHANHNREVCLLLKREKKHDWVVTTAFYSCIHRLYDSIFPLTLLVGDKVMIFQSFTDYTRHYTSNSNMGKHEMLGKAVAESGLPPKARTAYEILKSSSFTARYKDYRVSESLAAQSISRLDVIDTACGLLQSKSSGSFRNGMADL